MDWEGKERRGKKRYGIKSSTVRYRRGGLFSMLHPASPRYLLLNVSESGCHFITKEEIAVGEGVQLTLEAPKMSGTIRAKGDVVWCHRSEEINAFRVGIRFSSLGSPARGLLKKLLDNAILENVEISTRVYLKEIQKL
ncbi:MAG: PilZ domain-containing protein [Planctomycetota bacterium]|jgi:c-di-GMP-binding flagellar brake protein YcgR